MPRVPSDAAVHIGQLIAAQRKKRAFTQDELAASSGIDSSNIRAYEGGRAMPSIHSLLRIAIALDVDPAVLLNGLKLDHFQAPEHDGRRRRA